jgi:spore coat protein A
MLHCHMLQHEDHGMMTAFEVTPKGSGDAIVPGMDAALRRSIANPLLRKHVARVIAAAKHGRAAPASALPKPKDEVMASLGQLLADNSAYLCRA